MAQYANKSWGNVGWFYGRRIDMDLWKCQCSMLFSVYRFVVCTVSECVPVMQVLCLLSVNVLKICLRGECVFPGGTLWVLMHRVHCLWAPMQTRVLPGCCDQLAGLEIVTIRFRNEVELGTNKYSGMRPVISVLVHIAEWHTTQFCTLIAVTPWPG
jgi:hypothetical protein